MRLTVPALLLCFALLMAACSATATTTSTDVTITPSEAVTTTAQVTGTTGATTTTTAPLATSAPPATAAAGIEIIFAGGSVTGPDRIEVALGDQIEFSVVSDTADQVHVHGYDVFADVAPGSPGSFSFVADIPGIFEVELEGSHTVLVELLVQ